MKNTFRRKHLTLEQELQEEITKLIDKKGKASKTRTWQSGSVLKVKSDQQFNLDGGRYLVEISKSELVDNSGYGYHFSCLTLEQLCEIVDSFL